jgi:hypothetical protein
VPGCLWVPPMYSCSNREIPSQMATSTSPCVFIVVSMPTGHHRLSVGGSLDHGGETPATDAVFKAVRNRIIKTDEDIETAKLSPTRSSPTIASTGLVGLSDDDGPPRSEHSPQNTCIQYDCIHSRAWVGVGKSYGMRPIEKSSERP